MSTWAIFAKGWIGKAAGALNSKTAGLTNRAKEFGENRSYYQRRQMARDARQQERRRAHIEDYAGAATNEGWRGRALRRRAAGGMSAQIAGVFGREVNAAGQQRVLQNAQETLTKQRHEEADRAGKRMRALNIEGDEDLMSIARGGGYVDASGNFIQTPGVLRQRRNGVETGVTMPIGDAERQAAINELVSQGRIGPLRQLENSDPAHPRGPGGRPNDNNPIHHMLDEAYASVPNKIGDKAPDIALNRRASEGVAAFTDLQPKDVAGWHHSTVAAAERFYDADPAARASARGQAIRAFAEATNTPATLASLSPEQVQNFRNMTERFIASGGSVDASVRDSINAAYERKGFNISDPVPAAPPPPPTPPPTP